MSRGKAFYSRKGPSLRLYFGDIAVESSYMAQMNERLINAAERNHFAAEEGDLYKEIPRRHTETNINLDASADEPDNSETLMQKLLDEVKRGFPKNHRIRRVPKLKYNLNTITNALSSADSRNSRLFVIIDAIERDDEDKLKELIQGCTNPNLEYTLRMRQAEDLRCIIGTLQVEEQATWTILHEASSRGHADCVRVLLEAGADPNAVAVKNMTALDVAGSTYHHNHSQMREGLKAVTKVLLEAGGKFNTMKGRDDDNLDTALHTAAEIKSVETVKLLLEAGASVACLNTAGLTPLHICLQTKSVEVLDTLVNYNCKDISQKLERVDVTDKCGFTVLQGSVILNWIPGFRIVLEAGGQLAYSAKHSKSNLWNSPKWYQLLQSRNTPIHLAVARNNVEILDMMLSKILEIDALNCFNQECETPLHTAIKQGHLSCVKMLIFEGASISKVSLKNCNALHVAAEYDQTEILSFLLEYKDETDHIINALNKHGVAPLHCAVMNNNPECVTILLLNRADIRQRTFGRNSLTPLHIAASYNFTDVANVLLHHDKTTIDEVDNRGFSPLHAAAYNCCHDVILLLLKQGASLLSCTRGALKETTAINMIANKLPNPTSFFEEIFDSFINSKDIFGMTQINANYEVLGKIHEGHQMKILEEMVNCGQEKVLIHPFLESLIYLKWRTLLPFFYVILATYVFFVVSLNVLVVSVFYYNDKHEAASIFFNQTLWATVVYISVCFLLVQEFFYINVKRARYFCYVESWVKLGSIALAAILAGTICDSSWSESEWPRHVATMALLVSWVEIMFLISRFPSWGFYVLMFGSVSVTIIKILITFIFLVIAFSFSFMIQFQSTPPFDGLGASLLKTIVMMTSEFDYASFDNNFKLLSSSTTVVRLLFLFFLLFVSIVFMNFMVGVAVSDISNLNIQGHTKRLGKLVELLSTLEVVVHDGPLRKIIPTKTYQKIQIRKFLREISTFPGSEKTWSIMYGVKTDNFHFVAHQKVRLPILLANAFMDKAKKQTQLIDEENINNAYMDKINLLYKAVTSVKPVTRPVMEYHMSVLNAKFEKITSDMKKMNEVHSQVLTETLKKMEEVISKHN